MTVVSGNDNGGREWQWWAGMTIVSGSDTRPSVSLSKLLFVSQVAFAFVFFYGLFEVNLTNIG